MHIPLADEERTFYLLLPAYGSKLKIDTLEKVTGDFTVEKLCEASHIIAVSGSAVAELNNVSPTYGATSTYTIYGTGFQEGMTARLALRLAGSNTVGNEALSTIDAVKVLVISPVKAVIAFDMPDTGAMYFSDRYDLIVTCQGKTSRALHVLTTHSGFRTRPAIYVTNSRTTRLSSSPGTPSTPRRAIASGGKKGYSVVEQNMVDGSYPIPLYSL